MQAPRPWAPQKGPISVWKWFRDWRPSWWTPEQFVRTVSPTGQPRWVYVPAGSEWQPEFGTVVA